MSCVRVWLRSADRRREIARRLDGWMDGPTPTRITINDLTFKRHQRQHNKPKPQMTRMLDILEDFMVMRGHAYCRIDGNTSYEERENLIDTCVPICVLKVVT